jgi:ribose transport system permease protein
VTNIKSAFRKVQSQSWAVSVGASVLVLLILLPISSRNSSEVLMSNIYLASFVTIAGLGQMIVVSTGRGAVDLSIPYTITLCVYVATITQNGEDTNLALSVILSLAIGAAVGAINGFAVIVLKIPAMVATLAIGFVAQSVVQVLSSTAGHIGPSPAIAELSRADLFGFPVYSIIAIGVCFLVALLLYRTAFGVRLMGTGQNDIAARLAGLRPSRTRWIAFTLSGLLAGATAVLLGGYSGGASLGIGAGFLISSIASVVLGGTLMSGGRSSVAGIFGGALFLTLLVTLTSTLDMTFGFRSIIQGVVILVALGVGGREIQKISVNQSSKIKIGKVKENEKN